MTRLQLIGVTALLLAVGSAYADNCAMTIEANDMMRYNVREMSVPAGCSDITVTLKHSGKLEAKVMGHDWVLARTSDVSGIVNAGMAAGLAHGYLPAGDKRIIAATNVVGGGESTTVKFATSALEEGASYTFFCTTPGHATVMRGRFVFGDPKRVARADK
jgi:azurin